jgi:hypothetical protein
MNVVKVVYADLSLRGLAQAIERLVEQYPEQYESLTVEQVFRDSTFRPGKGSSILLLCLAASADGFGPNTLFRQHDGRLPENVPCCLGVEGRAVMVNPNLRPGQQYLAATHLLGTYYKKECVKPRKPRQHRTSTRCCPPSLRPEAELVYA